MTIKIAFFTHSLLSDWNHGNAHFLRGLVTELARGGHDVRAFEPRDGWSVSNLTADHGAAPLAEVRRIYPALRAIRYDPGSLDLDRALDGVDLVIVHEWNPPELVRAIGQRRARGGRFRLLFHDTHHRAATAPDQMRGYDLSDYDGVLAFGEAVREIYVREGWARRAFTFHEAADVQVFRPLDGIPPQGDAVWIGNWGDDERTRELREFLIEPFAALHLASTVYGVRYPEAAVAALARASIAYRGWLPNYQVPEVFAAHRVTVHVPRRPYARALPGIPTIRPFEALACGIPLISAPWADAEGLFRPGTDFLVASSGGEMKRHLRAVLADPDLAEHLREAGRSTILARHTCAHRAEELLSIARELGVVAAPTRPAAAELGGA